MFEITQYKKENSLIRFFTRDLGLRYLLLCLNGLLSQDVEFKDYKMEA
ncbi:hypothetical protein [Methanobrevibacter sp.]